MLKTYRQELDIYSGIAILFVVLLHTNAYYLANVLKLGSYIEAGTFLNFIDKVVHIAVPMFIFIAGYKYMMNNDKDTYRDYFMKKLLTVFKPFFILSTFYLCYHWLDVFIKRWMYTGVYDVQYVAENFIKAFARMFLGYNFAYQFWYIPMYLFICLTYPFLRRYLKSLVLRSAFFIILAIGWELVVLKGIPSLVNNPYPLKFIYYFFIYELGCSFYTYKSFRIKPGIYGLIYSALLIVVCCIKHPVYNRLIYELLYTPVAVVTFYHVASLIKENVILSYLGKFSFYIYLFHEPLVLSNLSRYLLRHGLYKSYFTAVSLAAVSIVISIIIYKVLPKGFMTEVRKPVSRAI